MKDDTCEYHGIVDSKRGSLLLVKRSLNNILWLQRKTLWKMSSFSTRLLSKLTSRSTTVETLVSLNYGNLPGQMWSATSFSRMAIYRRNGFPREMVLIRTHPRSPKTTFHNGQPRRLLSQIRKIWQHTPWPAIEIIMSDVYISIMSMEPEYFTGKMATRSGKIRKSGRSRFDFIILLLMQPYNAPNSRRTMSGPRKKKRGMGMSVITMISVHWDILS